MTAEVNASAGVLRFWWPDSKIVINVSRIHENGESPSAEVVIRTEDPMAAPHLHQTRLNLLSTQTKNKLAGFLAVRYKALEAPWDDIIEEMAVVTLRHIRQGKPVVHIDGTVDPPEQEFLVEPLMPLSQPTILYGYGGVGKSQLALYMAMCVQEGWQGNHCHFSVPGKRTNVLYLDWETDEGTFRRRAAKMRRGAGLARFDLSYLEMGLPLADDMERVIGVMMEEQTEMVIVDSAAAATGGDISAAEPTIRFFNALRQLNGTKLIIAHSPKPVGDKKETSVYGSVFFFNYARSVIEFKKSQREGADEIHTAMHHRKANDSHLFKPKAFHIRFHPDRVTVYPEDMGNVAEFASDIKAITRIEQYLLHNGRVSVKDIAGDLGIPEGTVRPYLQELKTNGKAIKWEKENLWAAAAEEPF